MKLILQPKQITKRTKIGRILCATLLTVVFANSVANQPQELVRPQVMVLAESIEPTPTPTPKQNNEVKDYIKEVFGKDSDKAFQLLQCENSALNPEAVNTAGNFPEGSRDIGVFQINEYWQKTQGKFLFNYKVNVLIAYQIYKDNGDSFHLWTCGRKLGI